MTEHDPGVRTLAEHSPAVAADRLELSLVEDIEEIRDLAIDLAAQPMLRRYKLSGSALWSGWQLGQQMEEVFWQARIGSRVVGMARAATRGGFAGPYLRFIGVASDCQSKGIGGLLLQNFQVDLASYATRGYFLLVADFNHSAHRFYKSHGYQQVGTLPGFVQAGIDELIFWRPLQP